MSGGLIKSRNWEAIESEDDIAGVHPHIEVLGAVEVSRTNLRAKLTEIEPQGINPTVLMLRLSIIPKGDVGNNVMTFVPATFTKNVHIPHYGKVEIYEGETKIETIEVSFRPV